MTTLSRVSPFVHSDIASVRSMAAKYLGWSRGEDGTEPAAYDVLGLVSTCLGRLAEDMEFVRAGGAAAYAVRAGVELVAVRVPGYGSRRNSFATVLDNCARNVSDGRTDAGLLMAYEVLRLADTFELYGSLSVDEWVRDDAAWTMAVEQAREDLGRWTISVEGSDPDADGQIWF